MAGLGLLEVVLAIAIFAFGMLALVQLQGNITRAGADANTRTIATGIAEEIIERIRAYRKVDADPDNGLWDYKELVGTALDGTVPIGDLNFNVAATITDYWWDPDDEEFVGTTNGLPPDELDHLDKSSYKLLQLDVSWGNREFYVDDTNTGDLATGNITIYEIIPSSPPILGAKVAAEDDGLPGSPPVEYTPGAAPDIIALQLSDDNKFKESTSPTPDIIRAGELAETWFDVVTYSGTANNEVFLRREEFVIVSCECELEAATEDEDGGFRPTTWNGYDYTEGEFVAKNFGVSANNQQSPFCSTCCRDHHDGGTGEQDGDYEDQRLVYNPWAASITPGSDHPHYSRDNQGDLELAGIGDVYVEACRLIRHDGFFRVAQDFNQKALFAFPEDYLDNSSEVGEYSDYVIGAVTEFVEDDLTDLTLPADMSPAYIIPASTTDNATSLPTALGGTEQQLRSRGVYVDYVTDEAQDAIDDCVDGADTCPNPAFTTAVELYPFFEVQLTWLSTWTEVEANFPVDVTSEPVEDDNSHDRGRAILQEGGTGQSEVKSRIHKGNIGFSATDSVIPEDGDDASFGEYLLYIDTVDGPTPPQNGVLVSGDIQSGVSGVRAADVGIAFQNAQCNRTATGFTCIVPNDSSQATLTVSGYHKANTTLYACSAEMVILSSQQAPNDNWTTFILPTYEIDTIEISIQSSACP
jgi:hypothetical protein